MRECINILSKEMDELKVEINALNIYQKNDKNTRIGKINHLKDELHNLVRPMRRLLITIPAKRTSKSVATWLTDSLIRE